jgi:hypothetical protein
MNGPFRPGSTDLWHEARNYLVVSALEGFMRTAVATALLAGFLLNAGAFACDNRAYLRARVTDANITVMIKNQSWPVRHPTTLAPCSHAGCFDA